MANIYEMTHDVLYYEADETGKLSLPYILNLAILSSTMQSVAYGIGPDETHTRGLGWIVLQHVMDIKRRPNIDETVILQTYAREVNPYFATRIYKIFDTDRNELVSIESLYAMLDMEKRKMARIPAEYVALYGADVVKKIPRLPEPTKISANESALSLDYRVRYTDIDSNKHVNNSKYFDWLQDVLGETFLQTHEPVQVNIKFEQEVRMGDVISSTATIGDAQTVHRIMNGDIVAAEASATWTVAD